MNMSHLAYVINVIDDLHDEISDTEILEELQEKKKQLLEINSNVEIWE